MNHHRVLPVVVAVLTLTLALAAPLASLRGQEPPAPAPEPTSVAATQERAKTPPPATVSLAFAGGTMAEFVAQLRAVAPRANILVAAAAADAVLPPIEIRAAGLDQVLEGACVVAESGQTIRVKEFRGRGESVFAILAQGSPQATVTPAVAARDEVTKVYSLNGLIADAERGIGFSVSTVLSAIEAASSDQPLQALRFHAASGVLVVRGRSAQINVVHDVLAQLESDVNERRERAFGGPGGAGRPTQPK